MCLLPVDSDASARAIRDGVYEKLGARVAVIVSDTFGRPWRRGLTDGGWALRQCLRVGGG